ncbi:MAG TPA: AbrB/MazE/SpoVT family DNA-binding domain-containing protein [Nitrososphaeraceae archaeon]|nr:AbrB/MazE/SpoVT family DNA-binding domain-containing protein [Nitrososphaeraceae archaeon]
MVYHHAYYIVYFIIQVVDLIIMGEVTTLALNSPNRASLRTTIPMFIVKQWGLHAGDKLDWSLEARENEIVILVKRAETKIKKKKG